MAALEAQWQASPPVHMLVAAYLGYKGPVHTSAPPVSNDADHDADSAAMPWLSDMGAIPAPESVRSAQTSDEALAAFERLFFGEVKDVQQL